MASSMLTAEVSASASTEADIDVALKTMLHSCANDPDFAIICDFLQKFSKDLGLELPNFKLLLHWLTKSDEVSPQLRDMQVKLLRKTRKTVHEKSWESALSKFCFTYSAQDAWEIERFGYKNSSVKVKLRILRELLECQFERNTKFRAKILTLNADSLRSQPIGRDRLGHAYWVTQDNDCNIRIYQEHLDEEIWQVVATNREEFVNLIKRLKGSEAVLPSTDIAIVDEDTTSSSSRIDLDTTQKPPLEDKSNSQEDEQKVPKLSIKIVHVKKSNEKPTKDIGKGEEELAAEEDAKVLKKSNSCQGILESDEEEFEEVEEEYEQESEENDDDVNDISKRSKKHGNLSNKNTNENSKIATDKNKKVKPLLISQNKVLNSENSSISSNPAKKRALERVNSASESPPRNEDKLISSTKRSRPSLIDSKRAKSVNEYEGNKEIGEENYEESTDEDDDVEDEIEEEDIDSVAAEEDENEYKQFDDYDDDDEEDEVGEEISDPFIHVMGNGSGKDCDVGNLAHNIDLDSENNEGNGLSEVIEEDMYYVWGEGYGKECLVGNNDDGSKATSIKNDTESSKSNIDVKNINDLEAPNSPNKTANLNLNEDKDLDQISPQKEADSIDDNETKKSVEDIDFEKNKDEPDKKIESISEFDTNQSKSNNEESQTNGENNHKPPSIILSEKQSDCEESHCKPKSSGNNCKVSEAVEIASSKGLCEAKDIALFKSESDITKATIEQTHARKMSALESLKKELRESKQKLLEKSTIHSGDSCSAKISNILLYNRKRRITDQQTVITRPSNSESEIDLNSENVDDIPNDQELIDEDIDVGGKRLKMRPKQTNFELRKKIEAQKIAVNDETTSSSGDEEELRRRKKIILNKEQMAPQIIKSEVELKKLETTRDNVPNEENCTSTKMSENTTCSNNLTLPQETLVKKTTQITPTKIKPTLAEIIEKKLKKTPEKNDKESVTETETSMTVKSIFLSPMKSPITKPLKKNLLNQIRQEENEEDAVPRKRTTSQELTSSVISTDIKTSDTQASVDSKARSKIEVEKQRITPDRQRKRRSSEEALQNENPEEPEAKKESTVVKNEDIVTNRNKLSNVIKEENINATSEEIAIKKEIITESVITVSSRRSGRRSTLASVYVDTIQSKKNRGSSKTAIKKEDPDIDKTDIKEENQSNESKTISPIVKSNVISKNEKDKISDEKPNLNEKDSDNTRMTKTNISETKKVETVSKSKSSSTSKTPLKGTRKKREVDTINIINADSETPVRQSRRIAQQKIREEAERRKLEEIALRTMKQELKKKKKAEKQADPTVEPPSDPSSESEESNIQIKKKVQKKKCPGKNGNWSSGSEEQEEPDEEDEEPPHYETDPGSPLFRSDHEFSPESDIEDESQVVPMKRARTVRKEDGGDDALNEEEEACQKCNKSDHPEWILLCDNCDKGYHCSCLSPVLFYIPEGDWYCPPCQQEQLIKALENQLKEFDDLVENKKKQKEEEKRLAEEERARKEKEEGLKKHKINRHRTNIKEINDNSSGENSQDEGGEGEEISENSDDSKKQSFKFKNRDRLRNAKNEKRNHRDRRHNVTRGIRSRMYNRSESDSEDSNKSNSGSGSSSSSSSTYSDSDNEPIYKLRKRRQINVSYRLNEYDDLINSALKKEMDDAAGAGNLGRGKDISTIIEADKEEKARQKQLEGDAIIKTKDLDDDEKENERNKCKSLKAEIEVKKQGTVEEDVTVAESIIQKLNIKQSLKKKARKLTTLDISSEDDDGSDEDFKGSSLDEDEEEDTSISVSNSDSSLDIYKRHGRFKKKRRRAARRAFRERRKDKKFIVEESDDEVQRPKSKKKRKDDSDYTESEADDDDLSELSENIDSADLCDDTTTEESDGAWRPNKRKKAKKSTTSITQKSPKSKSSYTKKSKRIEYSDDDISESEEDENEENGSGKGMGKQPRSQPLKSIASTKPKGKGNATKKKKKSSEDELSQSDSEDSTRRTRGRRYAYLEDFDDESSDGGIKPGVQRPDTPPEEREKFIKRQEEIKRMLAEKNAEGAKLVATPRLTPIKTDTDKDKRSPVKTGGDSLSTVPLSVIRQAKVLDIDYLHRRGENLDDLSNDVGEVDDDFDAADLPDDLPEDMDEDAIARMVEEEEEFSATAAKELPPPDEVLRTPPTVKPKIKEPEKAGNTSLLTNPPQVTVNLPTSISGLQEPVRKRLPMPTMHPPLLRHQFLMHESMTNTHHHLMQRHGGAPTSHLLQNALSAPLAQPLDRNFTPTPPSPAHHSMINRMTHSISLQPSVSHALNTTKPPTTNITKSSPLLELTTQEKSVNPQPTIENKPRGRRKKITPLRDTLQKQQTAAAVTAATATSSALASAMVKNNEPVTAISLQSSVIKGPPTKLPIQTSVITSMPPSSHSITNRPGVGLSAIRGTYARSDGPRFYDSPDNRISQTSMQRHRGPLQMPSSLLPPHPANRPSYGPPPPLKGSSTASAPTSASIRNPVHHVPPPYLGVPPNARHSSPHLNIYRPPIYGNPNFGPRVNLRPPSSIHAPEFPANSRAYAPYGFYPPPPPLTTPGQRPGPASRPSTQIGPVQSALGQQSTPVIVSTAAVTSAPPRPTCPAPSSEIPEPSSKPVAVRQELPIKVTPPKSPLTSALHVLPQTEKQTVVTEPRKKLTTLQAFTIDMAKKSSLHPAGESSGSHNSPRSSADLIDDSSITETSDNTTVEQPTTREGQASEFSGLVSYFSSQHDDYNT